MDLEKMIDCVVLAAKDKKATRLIAQDLHGVSSLCDAQLVCSGANERQTQAICRNIEDKMREELGLRPLAIEGKSAGNWILMDYGSLMIHIFLDSLRDYYGLERLWPKAHSKLHID